MKIIIILALFLAAPASAVCGNQFETQFHKIAPGGESYAFTVDPGCVLVTGQTFVNKGLDTHIALATEIDMTLEGPSPSDCTQSAPLELCVVQNPIPGEYVLHVDRVKGRPNVRIAAGTQ